MKSTNRSYLPRLDYVRGLAAWWVVMHHASAYYPLAGAVPNYWAGSPNPFLVLASQGWLAVGLFLMISGFSLGRGFKGREIRWGGYLSARWLRVAPLYLFLLFLGTLAVGGSPSTSEFAAALTLLPIPGAYSPGAWMGVTWSVRVEFLLYFTIPALVVLARTVPIRRLAVAGPALAFIVFWLLVLNGTDAANILYWGLPGRLFEFATGFFIGYFGIKVRAPFQRTLGITALVGYSAMAFVLNRQGGFVELTPQVRFTAYFMSIALACCVLIWVQNPRRIRLQLVDSAGRNFGFWSYSTYMWHAIVITLVSVPLWTRLGEHGWSGYSAMALGLAVAIVLTALVSWLSFTLIESPFLALRPKYVLQPPQQADLADKENGLTLSVAEPHSDPQPPAKGTAALATTR